MLLQRKGELPKGFFDLHQLWWSRRLSARPGAVNRQLEEPLVHKHPRGVAMRQQVTCAVELAVRSSILARIFRPHRHGYESRVGRFSVARRPHPCRRKRPRELEVGIPPLELEVLDQDPEEHAKVGVVSVAPGPLALLDDRLDRRMCRGEVGHRDQLGPPEVPHGGLGLWRSNEDSVLSVLLYQALEALFDPPVEMTNGGELLLVRHDDAARDKGRYHRAREL